MDRVAKDSDELLRMMLEDELSDAELLPPIQYARLRGLFPQQVYRALRNKKLEPVTCPCGRKCVNVQAADKVFKVGEHAAGRQGTTQADSTEEEASGGDLDT